MASAYATPAASPPTSTRLQGALDLGNAREFALHEPEDRQRRQREDDREVEGGSDVVEGDVWGERNNPAGDVGRRNRHGALQRPLRIRFLKTQLEAHHEVPPCLRFGAQALHDRAVFRIAQPILAKELSHFLGLDLRFLNDLGFLAR